MKVSKLLLASVAVFIGGCGVGRGGGGGGGGGGLDASVGADLAPQCTNLQCQQIDCGEQGPTTLTGTVFAPNGTLPLYNAIVYVPNAPVDKFTDGVTCDRCDGHVSGSPLVQALTGPDGRFELKNVPAGDSIPLVIQLGKWRRQVTIPNVPQCTTSGVGAELTRLPKNHVEGDIPRIAIATGSADPMECLLLKIGLDPKEIQEPVKNTRVAFYVSGQSGGTTMSNATPKADDPNQGLYTQMNKLMSYDIVMLPCQGGEYDQSAGASNIVNYLNLGGRVFSTHYSYDWLTYANSPYNKVAKPQLNGLWPKDQSDAPFSGTINAKLVTNFPKGMAFAKWLKFAGAASAPNTLDIKDIRHDINGVDSNYAQSWATDSFNGTPGVAHLTFNTPIDATKDDGGVPNYCGRVVYSDFHVAASEVSFGQSFPNACLMGPMTDQEKALAFMLFDLSSCVQSDMVPPVG